MFTKLKRSALDIPEDELRADIRDYQKAMKAHAKTEGKPAPMPRFELSRIVTEDFEVLDDTIPKPIAPKPTERELEVVRLTNRKTELLRTILLDLLDYVASQPEADRKFRAARSELDQISQNLGDDNVL